MSYDLNVWSIKPAKIPESLPEYEKWENKDGSAILDKKDWQIVVTESAKVEEEDIPEEVMPFLPGIKYLTQVNLEPIHAPASGKSLLYKITRDIAKETIGVIEDQQENTLSAPSGVKRYTPVVRTSEEKISVIEMSWWFTDIPGSTEELLRKLTNYFERNLPEALPRRYGEYEPPKYKYEETGKDHFINYASGHVYDSLVIYTRKPVVDLHYSLLKQWGFIQWANKKEFRSNHFSLQIDSTVLSQPGWEDQLRKIFDDISMMLNPFYGEVRTLHNHIYRNGKYYTDFLISEENPVKSWWWKGIPQILGQAIVIGEPYLSLWKQVQEKGKMKQSLCFVSTENWALPNTVNEIVGKVPKDISQIKIPKVIDYNGGRTMDYNEEFPPVFPFDKEAEE